MSEQKKCPGKYHGEGIKYIDDGESYCKICQQNMSAKSKQRNEILGGIVSVVGLSLLGALGVKSRTSSKS